MSPGTGLFSFQDYQLATEKPDFCFRCNFLPERSLGMILHRAHQLSLWNEQTERCSY